jgi:hypothetical protein
MPLALAATALGLVANLAANLVSGNPDPNYLMTFVPLLAAPYAWLFGQVRRAVATAWHTPRLATAAITLCAMGLAGTTVMSVRAWFGVTWGDTSAAQQAAQLFDWTDSVTAPGARVQFIDTTPAANYGARRAAGAARIYQPMDTFEAAFRQTWRDDIAAGLCASPPDMLLFNNQLDLAWLDGLSPAPQACLRSELAAHYQLVENPHGYVAYARFP